MKRSLLLVLPLLCAQISRAQSTVPSSISYQGRVADAAGVLIGDPTPVNRTITLRIYGSPTGSDVLYAEQQIVTIAKGQFSVLLGTGLPSGSEPKPAIIEALGGAERFLGITVDDGTPTADPEISPRQQLVSSAFAMRSRTAESSNTTAFATTAGTAQHVQALPGDTSNFNWINANNLTVNGHSKITGQNVLELGVGRPRLAGSAAGQIGYQTFSNGLDILGAVGDGTSNDRRITLWAESGTELKGAAYFGQRLGQHLNLYADTFGIGIESGTLFNRSADIFKWYRGGNGASGGSLAATIDGNGLTLNSGSLSVPNGRLYGSLDRGAHGVFAGSYSDGHSFGSQDWTTYARTARSFAWYLNGNWTTLEKNPGGGSTLAVLDANGLRLTGQGGGSTRLELGYGVAGKESNAGTIGYKVFSDGVDIVGAGTSSNGSDRKVQVWAEAGTTLTGGLTAAGNVEGNDVKARSWVYCNNVVYKNNSGGYRWETKGPVDYEFVFDGSTRYRIDGNGNTFRVSDRAMKKDILPFTGILAKVMKLKPATYHFKADAKDKPLSYGFIAQEVQEIFPELVTKMDDKVVGLNYEGLIPVTVAALQEHQKALEAKDAEIAALKKELAAAKEANSLQDTRLAAIEKALKLEATAAAPEKKTGGKLAAASPASRSR